MNDTIAAIATATGVGSIAIVRVSGAQALELAYKLTKRKKLKKRYATLTSLYNKKHELIDQAIVLYFKAPKSFTGEDIVEFQCHGGFVVAQEILDTLISYGARLAQPGEFTKRAFLNGKIDLSEAEAIAKIIESKSIDGAKVLARQLKGELKEFIEQAREKLLLLLAHSEVMIDYAEEDIPPQTYTQMQTLLDELLKQLQKIVESSLRRKGIIEGFYLAIVGRPNVGKSSILNKMLNFNRAIVSDIAGTTRDSIEEQLRIGSHIVKIADTAGIRNAKDAIEQIGVERSIKWLNEADIIIAVFDASFPLTDEDEKVLQLLSSQDKNKIIIAFNKIDKTSQIDFKKFSHFPYQVQISAKESVDALLKIIEELLNNLSYGDDLMLISNRQINSAKKALKALQEAKEPLERFELEFFSYHINDAISALNEISKPFQYEELLDKMFGEFCLGK